MKGNTRIVGAVAGLLLARLLPGCQLLLGEYSSRAEGADAGASSKGDSTPLLFSDATCAACVEQQCRSETTECLDKDDCDGWLRCWAACPLDEVGCRTACYGALQRTDSFLGEVVRCTVEHCHRDCATGGLERFGNECDACFRQDCQPQIAACAGDPQCLSRVRCDYERDAVSLDPGDVMSCHEAHDVHAVTAASDGGVIWSTWMQTAVCANGACRNQCLFGQHYACGSYTVGTPASDLTVPVRLHFSPGPELPGEPIAGVVVTACRLNDRECVDPVDADETDSEGRVVLRLGAGEAGVYFEAQLEQDGVPIGVIHHPMRSALTTNAEISFRVPVALFQTLGAAPPSGVLWESGTGYLDVTGRDCVGAYARDLTFSINAEADVQHAGNDPVVNQGFSAERTFGYGAAFVNVSPGYVNVEARSRDGKLIASKRDVVIKANTWTGVPWLWPDP